MNTVLLPKFSYLFYGLIVGNDIVVDGVWATWFGGTSDPQDDGTTASGANTKTNPKLVGCSLPMDYHRPKDNPCAGSPLPKLPWFSTKVEVTNKLTGKVCGPYMLIDEGPKPPPIAIGSIDLTPPAFLDAGGDLGVGRIPVSYRIIDGAKILGITRVPQQPAPLSGVS